jgi:hypothetical protein
MSRINELKKQYPELNITMFDLMVRLDTTKTHKYLPLMCKIFGKRFNVKEMWRKDELSMGLLELQSNLINKGISTDGLTDNQMFYLSNYITENFTTETYHTLKLFMEYMDKNMIEKNDVTSYKDIDDIRGAVTLATMKGLTKELEGQVIKEYEDEKWVVVRPLTFSASAKYGSSTRWCTTYQKEKNYFEKYWRRGILVYFINKETGYKFAGYKGLDGDSEFSFWNAEDSRVDYLDVDADDYLYPIVKKIFRSEFTNKNLCSDEIQQQVYTECISVHEKMRIEFSDETIPLDEQPRMEQPELPVHNYQREIGTIRELLSETENEIAQGERQVRELLSEFTNVPTMRA